MTTRSVRATVLASAVAIMVAMLGLLAVRGSIRHHVLHSVSPEDPLPQLTELTRPLIGGPFSEGSILGLAGSVLWLVLVFAPILLSLWAIRPPDANQCAIRWLLALAVYLPICAAIIIATGVGLWAPFQFIKWLRR